MSVWTQEEISILNNYKTKTIQEFYHLLPNRSRTAIRGKIERLNLRKRRGIDYTNKRIGQLTFIERVNIQHKYGVMWSAKCDCGKLIDIIPTRTNRMKIPSCGCARPVIFKKDPKKRTLENRLRTYKQRASRDSIDWQLTDDEFFAIIQQACHYCGQAPDNIINAYRTTRHKNVQSKVAQASHQDGAISVNGIDRINSNAGYVKNNCVPCCQYCNYAKRERPHKEFIDWINRLILFQGSK